MKNSGAFSVAVKLFIITAAAALCLAVVNSITSPIIAENSLKNENEARIEMLPSAKEFKKTEVSEKDYPSSLASGVTIENVYVGLDGEKGVGYVVTVTSNAGYGGNIKVVVGLDNEKKILNTKILESSETAGLGLKASKPEFLNQYIGKKGKMVVVKGESGADNEISAISSATITSNAVTDCINAATEVIENKLKGGFAADTAAKVEAIVSETLEKTEEQIKNEGGAQ